MRNHLRASTEAVNTTTGLYQPTPAKTFLIRTASRQELTVPSLPVRKRSAAVDVYGDLLRVSPVATAEMTTVRAVTRHRQSKCLCLSAMIWKQFSILWKDHGVRGKEVQTMKPGAKVLPHFYQRYNRSQPYFSVCLLPAINSSSVCQVPLSLYRNRTLSSIQP